MFVSNSNLSLNKNRNNGIELGDRLRTLSRLDEAEKIFHHLLSQYPSRNSQLYDGLARAAQDKGLYNLSLQLYEKSLAKISSKDRPRCLNNIGCIYDYIEKYDLALDFYLKALTLMINDIDRAIQY